MEAHSEVKETALFIVEDEDIGTVVEALEGKRFSVTSNSNGKQEIECLARELKAGYIESNIGEYSTVIFVNDPLEKGSRLYDFLERYSPNN